MTLSELHRLPVTDSISSVLRSDRSDLGLTTDAAEHLMRCIENGYNSDDALTAYDLLHSRVTFGRAF